MESNKNITVSVHTDNKEGCAAIASMFAGLAGQVASTRVEMVHGLTPILPPQPSATTPHGDFTREQVDAAEALAAAGTECPGVNVAAALATVPGGTVTEAPVIPPVPFTPPAASVAPPAPVAAPSAPTPAGPELDKNGLPWDARINTSNVVKTQQGVWKMKKGLPEGYYDQVVAELKGVMAAPAPAAPTPTPAAPAAPQPPVPAAPTVSAAPTTTVPQPPSASPVAAASPGVQTASTPDSEPEPTTYPQLLQAVSKRTMTSKITADEVNSVCQMHGIPSINLVANRPDLFSVIYQGCAAIWNAR